MPVRCFRLIQTKLYFPQAVPHIVSVMLPSIFPGLAVVFGQTA
jgi:hypothetical protein